MGEPLVVIGNGMAATRFVDELTQRTLGRYSVIVIGAESRLSYNRVLLSSLLAGEVDGGRDRIEAARMVEQAWRHNSRWTGCCFDRARFSNGDAREWIALSLF